MQKYGTHNSSPNAMVVIGLTGSIGSGKSEVARILRQEGVPVLSSDTIAHTIVDEDPDVRSLLRQRFGEKVVPPDAPTDRHALAQILFGPTEQHDEDRRYVERIVHPRVLEQIARQLDELDQQGVPLAVVESALIYDAGIEDLFDYIVVVTAPASLRRERVRARNSNDDFTYRQRAQLPEVELRERADFVVDNSGTLDDLRQATLTLLGILRHLPPRPAEFPPATFDEQAAG